MKWKNETNFKNKIIVNFAFYLIKLFNIINNIQIIIFFLTIKIKSNFWLKIHIIKLKKNSFDREYIDIYNKERNNYV